MSKVWFITGTSRGLGAHRTKGAKRWRLSRGHLAKAINSHSEADPEKRLVAVE
jgi:hypothetical protein